MQSSSQRIEHDLLGDKNVPSQAYFGVHTARALENFPITGIPISRYPDLVNALAAIKQAAAITNRRLGLLDDQIAWAIVSACKRIRDGELHEEFVVDVIQGGAGTSTNMNANEVVANLALEILGSNKGEYQVLHPNEHVNMSQSTNDVYPTAVKLAARAGLIRLLRAMDRLKSSFAAKAEQFNDVIKLGRTQLQDAVPMTLGQEFSAFADMLEKDIRHLESTAISLCEINLGATAIGTGINAHPDYSRVVCEVLSALLGIPLVPAANLIRATQDCGCFVEVSGALKRAAINLSKTCNDLRLLASGPRTGLGEINLPPRQAGSSIMPGKVNPVIPEVVNQIAFEVIGNDLTIAFAAEAGQLQLNAFEPIIAHSLFKSLDHLRQGCLVLADHCVSGISANGEQLRDNVERSIGVITALNPFIGYGNASQAAAEAHATGQGVVDVVLKRGLMSAEQLREVLRPERLTQPQDIELLKAS